MGHTDSSFSISTTRKRPSPLLGGAKKVAHHILYARYGRLKQTVIRHKLLSRRLLRILEPVLASHPGFEVMHLDAQDELDGRPAHRLFCQGVVFIKARLLRFVADTHDWCVIHAYRTDLGNNPVGRPLFSFAIEVEAGRISRFRLVEAFA